MTSIMRMEHSASTQPIDGLLRTMRSTRVTGRTARGVRSHGWPLSDGLIKVIGQINPDCLQLSVLVMGVNTLITPPKA
jgi:hypothetical protein